MTGELVQLHPAVLQGAMFFLGLAIVGLIGLAITETLE